MKRPIDIANLRAAYAHEALDEDAAAEDPIDQFGEWFHQAVEAGVPEPNACTLATVGDDGMPAARIILLKGFDPEGFVFFTNYESRKARDLDAGSRGAALVFWWIELARQVRIEGTVTRVSQSESDVYWASRPRGSQLGAWASEQSQNVTSRAELEKNLADISERYRDEPVPRPLHWGGYLLSPSRLEFWQGRPDRLHDRLLYEKSEDGWVTRRLAP